MADNSAGRPVEARRALTAALAEIERVDGAVPDAERLTLLAQTLITLALTDLLLSGLGAARGRLAEAERVVDELGDPAMRARLDYQRANIHGRVGDLAAAWAGLEAAAAQLHAFTPREQCSVLLSRGMLAFERSLPGPALDSFVEAGRLAHEHGFATQEFMARHNEGYAAYLLGDLPRALATMAAADGLPADVSRAQARLDRGHVLLEAGLVLEALDVFDAGLAGLVGDGHDQLRAEFDLELARGRRLAGRLDAAATDAAASREAFTRIGATAWAGKAALVGLLVELDRHRRGRPGEALGAVAALADDVSATGATVGDRDLADAARVVAGEAHLLAGHVDAARERVLGGHRMAFGSLSDELAAAAVTASVHVAAGEPARARRVLTGAARRLSAGQQGSASLDVRTARAVHGVRLAALDLELALPRGSGAVLEALERWRSATDRLPSLGRPADEQLAQLTEQLRSVRTQQRRDPDRHPDHALARDLGRRASRLEQQIRARDWALSSETEVGAAVPVRIREAREALTRADRDLVWLFPHGGRLCGVGVVGGRATVHDLLPLAEAAELARRTRLDLRAAATRLLGPFSASVWGSLHASVARLDDALVRPWRSTRGLVLVTATEVSALPWALLPSLAGRPVTVARSLTAFARRERPPGPWDPAGPAVHVSVGPAVARGAAEARAIAATWGDRARVADPSRAAGLVGALAEPGVVHVAAHGTHQVESPLFSSVALHDGPVFAHELQPTGVRADHVVLSACDVGIATARPNDESLGLAASMLSLGARSVVAAVAPVPDDVAADTMVRHHEALARGVPSDEALAGAVEATAPVAAAFLALGGRFRP